MANGLATDQTSPSTLSVGPSSVTDGVVLLGPTETVPPTTAVPAEPPATIAPAAIAIDPSLTITITPAPETPAVFGVEGPFTVQQASIFGGTLVAGFAGDFILAGGPAEDFLIGSDFGTNVLIGGNGDNTFTAVGAATTFVHNAGANDVITDFDPEIGDHITWDKGLAIVRSGQGTITDPQAGLDGAQGLVVEFTDGSKIGIPTVTDQTALAPDWVIAPPDPASPATYAALLPTEDGSASTVTVQGTPVGGAGLGVAGFLGSGVLLGGPGNDALVGSALGLNNVLAGGGGQNILTSSGTATFVHNSGANDVVTGFDPGLDHLTWDAGLTVVQSGQSPIQGFSPGLVVAFSDQSTLALPGMTTVTELPADWLV